MLKRAQKDLKKAKAGFGYGATKTLFTLKAKIVEEGVIVVRYSVCLNGGRPKGF
jgi:hypothetical protein